MTTLKRSFLFGIISCLFFTLAYAAPSADALQSSVTTETNKFASSLETATQLIYDRQLDQANAVLDKIPLAELTNEQKNQHTLLTARIALLQHDGDAVLHLLERIEKPDSLSAADAITYHLLAAHGYIAQKKPLASIRERVALQFLIKDEKNQQLNYERLWQTLQGLDPLPPEAIEQESIEVADWLHLANLVKAKPQDAQTQAAIILWQTQHAHHPGIQFIQNRVTQTAVAPASSPNGALKVAMLLPLTGPLAEAGKAVKNGFIAALESDPKMKGWISLQVYDTNQTQNITALYDKALQDGARFVIGPMQKNAVIQLSKRGHFEVPTLALNYAPLPAQPNFFQFGLSPQDEASQVAKHAFQDGKRAALILAPKDEWGQGIVDSFLAQWQSLGGRVVAAVTYAKTDMMDPQIRRLLEIDKSNVRRNEVQQVVGTKLSSDARHRQDADMLFLVGSPTIARQIRPLLKFHYASSLPVYSSSMIYSGIQNPQDDRDNDGVRFCDMPWILQASQFQNKKNQLLKLVPRGINNNIRLYAIGMDSLALIAKLNNQEPFPNEGLAASSGRLFINPSQQISRELLWASFRNGVPIPNPTDNS